MPIDYVHHVRSESARFLSVLRDADPAAPVPSCPEWTAADLLWHLAEVQMFWGVIVRDRLADPGPSQAAKPARADDYAGLLGQFEAASATLSEALAAADPGTPVWTWSEDHTAGWVRRRMAQEALVHRLDAELTVGQVSDLDPTLAADGVREALEVFYAGRTPSWATFDASGPVGRIELTDTGDTFLIRVGTISGSPAPGREYTDEPSVLLLDAGDPTFTVRGSARDVEAWLWNRPTLQEVETGGDEDDLARFRAVVADAI